MRTLIVGGTGFIGYHTVYELLRRGHQVSVLARHAVAPGSLFPPEVAILAADVTTAPDHDLRALLAGHDAVVYATGVDDRSTFRAPAYPQLFRGNVLPAARLFALARATGIRRGVLLSSYFCHFDRIWPQLQLSLRHPYIRSRREQERQALAAAGRDLSLVILELPYIFGAPPGRRSQWAAIVDYVRSPLPVLLYTAGGSNMMAVQHVAEAIAGGLERGPAPGPYVIGDENLSWSEWLRRLAAIAGHQKPVLTVPTSLVRVGLRALRLVYRLRGRERGLEPVAYGDLQTAETFFDPASSQAVLGYGRGGLDEALRATVASS